MSENVVVADQAVVEMLRRINERLERMGPVLSDLHKTVGSGLHSPSPRQRTHYGDAAAAKKR